MRKIIYIALSATFLVACSTSNDVVSSNKIQKRKYTKGWHIKKSKNYKSTNSTNEEGLAKNDGVRKVRPEENHINLASKKIEFKVDNSVNRDLEELNYAKVKDTKTVEKEAKTLSADKGIREKLVANESTDQITKIENDKEVIQSKSESNAVTENKKDSSSGHDETDLILLYVLAVVIPFVAVGIVTDWDLGQVLLNVLLCLLCGIPGIVHAIIVVRNNA